MDEVYRDYRIALTEKDGWRARITHVRGSVAPFSAAASSAEGSEACAERARHLIDRYIAFLDAPGRPEREL